MNPVNKILGKKHKRKIQHDASPNDTYSKSYIDYNKLQGDLDRREKQVWIDYEKQKIGKYRNRAK